MSRAFLMIRNDPVYRREAFAAGLRAQGFDVRGAPGNDIKPGDVLVCWNRYQEMHELACRFEAAGASVIVAENGYLGVDRSDRKIYAMADGYHNGRGCWHVGGADRFAAMGITLQPWRTAGKHVLVCPNREFGTPGGIQPGMFAEKTAAHLSTLTRRPIRVRPHPGNGPPKKPLADDLADAWAVVIWSSSAGVDALVAGIPVFCMSPYWICKSASFSNLKQIDAPPVDTIDRAKAFRALAWAQWSVQEIESGEPFRRLLKMPVQFAPG